MNMIEALDSAIALAKDQAEEFHYLEWFRMNCDFGPAHDDVIDIMNEQYENETGNKIPKCWKEGEW